MTEALRTHFADYAAFHRTVGNRACHSFGIPIIVLALVRAPRARPARRRWAASS